MAQNINRLTISAIFEKDKQEKYTPDALLRQDILRYYFVNSTALENTPFRLKDLQKWIVKNNLEIKNRYVGSDAHTPIQNRVHSNTSRIESKFHDLFNLRLIRRSMTTKLQSPSAAPSIYTEKISYEYTSGGIFLALLIKSMNLRQVIDITKSEDKSAVNRRDLENIQQDIYDCLVNLVFETKENSLAGHIFYSALFKKCKDKDIFDKFVDRIHYIITNSHSEITSILNLFGRAVNFTFFNAENSETVFTDILIETIKKLDQKDKKLVLNQLKILTEEDYQNSQEDLTREYEEFRFELRTDYEHIAIQGYCENCKSKQNVKPRYLDFRKNSAVGIMRLDCPSCKSSKTVLISNRYY